jgi:O-succinylbenzoic acid--CoA ligase
MNIVPSPLGQQARRNGSSTACITPFTALTYEEVYSRAAVADRNLESEGISDGDRIGILMDNSLELFLLLHACFERGTVAAPISTRIPTDRLRERLEQIGADTMITGDTADLPKNPGFRVLHTEQILEETSVRPVKSSDIDLDGFATVVFTSGSTGQPKPALHTYGNHYFNAAGSNTNIRVSSDDRWMLSLPLYHVGGLAILFRCLLAGAAVVIPSRDEQVYETMSRYDITHASLVSTQLRRLLSTNLNDINRLHALLIGGSAVPNGLIDAAFDRHLPIHVSYGLTEMSSQVTTTPPGASISELHTSGRTLPYRKLKIAPDGEVLVRGRTLFAGYLRDGSLDRSLDAEGWFHTRDVGHLDDQGCLQVLGRKDNMFISGGENIQPETIETALEQLDSIVRAVVVPVSDEEFGHRPVAFVQWHRHPRSLDEIHSALADQLERFKLPIAIYPLSERDEDSKRSKIDRSRLVEYAEIHHGTGDGPDASIENA